MTSQYKFSEQDLIELIGDDVSLPGSLATLINEGGDIRSYFIKKLQEREEESAKLHLSQSGYSDADDWNSMQDAVDAREASYINQTCFG